MYYTRIDLFKIKFYTHFNLVFITTIVEFNYGLCTTYLLKFCYTFSEECISRTIMLICFFFLDTFWLPIVLLTLQVNSFLGG